jgi:hypothetical protein
LFSFLSEDQQRTYLEHESIEVVGSAGGRYLIRSGVVGNIAWMNEQGERGGTLCCHPVDERLPLADIMLAQMLALVTDEESFVRLANRYSGDFHPLTGRRRRRAVV